MGRLILFEPKNLWSGEPRQHVVADPLQKGGTAAQPVTDFFALCSGGSIAPEFGGTDHLMIHIERHQPVLLPGNPDRPHFRPAGT